jgi:hypothetical protein
MQQETSEAAPKWTDTDTDALFRTLGKYWVIFQSIEAQLDKLILLALGSDNWTQSQAQLARMSNAQKIDRVESIVLTSPDFARVHTRPDWVAHFKSIIEALHAERESRNALTHSQMLFEFADKGMGPPLLSTRIKNDDLFERHWMSKEFQNEMLARIGKLAFDMNFIYVQLVHDFQAPQSSWPSKPT